jgi:hypothetical protein
VKVILSRKGFDSEFGGGPSPIMPDGRLISLPIPSQGETVGYRDLKVDQRTYAGLMEELRYTDLKNGTCHVDPDLSPGILDRQTDWVPLFGQVGAAEGHLRNQQVGPGDLFLFFGWFRRTVETDEGLRFDPADPIGRHVIYGYMEVGDKVDVTAETVLPEWMTYHPHCHPTRRSRTNNVIYIASRCLSWNVALPGGGCLEYRDALVLTANGQTRSRWALPDCFRSARISYHSEKAWRAEYFQSQAKGQEFVCDSEDVAEWARALVTGAAHRTWT